VMVVIVVDVVLVVVAVADAVVVAEVVVVVVVVVGVVAAEVVVAVVVVVVAEQGCTDAAEAIKMPVVVGVGVDMIWPLQKRHKQVPREWWSAVVSSNVVEKGIPVKVEAC